MEEMLAWVNTSDDCSAASAACVFLQFAERDLPLHFRAVRPVPEFVW
jgi:hypothetical protein